MTPFYKKNKNLPFSVRQKEKREKAEESTEHKKRRTPKN
jgi:hypothetical protein